MNLNEIIEESKNKKNLPNKKLVEMMRELTDEFEKTKKELIILTQYFDKLEETYDSLLTEYETRQK
jgi:polyhydroxyalkanoate synthesis regulator phasin